jgi:hypothetical protein
VKPFVFRPETGPWAFAPSWLFVCIVPDLDRDKGLAELVQGCREAMAGFPIDVVGDQALRVTLAQVSDAPSTEIADAGRELLVGRLAERLGSVRPVEITAGSPLAYATGALCDLEVEPLAEVVAAVRSTIRDLRGAAADTYETGVIHLTLGYATDEAPTDDLARCLRRVRPSHARMSVGSVHLLEVSAAPETGFSWRSLAEIPLGRR